MLKLALAVGLTLTLASGAEAADGKTLFAAKGCAACHGPEGKASMAGTPHLAGQNAAYLLRQMTEIADGTRNTPPVKPMTPVIAKTSAEERKALADWLAAQTPASPASGDLAKAEKGELLFEENGCIGCHGASGAKPLADYPILAGQRKDYIATQIKAIRDELRSTRRARLMVANVRQFKDAEAEQLAEFLSQAKRK